MIICKDTTSWHLQLLNSSKSLIMDPHSLTRSDDKEFKLAVSVFDPLGLLSPFVINLKVLFQHLCTFQN